MACYFNFFVVAVIARLVTESDVIYFFFSALLSFRKLRYVCQTGFKRRIFRGFLYCLLQKLSYVLSEKYK